MPIKTNQTKLQDIYSQGTQNPKGKKTKAQKNTIQPLQQNQNSKPRPDKTQVFEATQANEMKYELKKQRQSSRDTYSTNYRTSPDRQQNTQIEIPKKVISQHQNNPSSKTNEKEQKNHLNHIQTRGPIRGPTPENERETRTLQPIESLNRCEEVVIEEKINVLCPLNNQKMESRHERFTFSVDRSMTQRQRYYSHLRYFNDLKLLEEKSSNFSIKKMNVNPGKKWNFRITTHNGYSYHFQNSKLATKQKVYMFQTSNFSEQLKLTMRSLNVDTYFQAQDRKRPDKYPVPQHVRIRQVLKRIEMWLEEGIGFINLQQVCSQSFRAGLLQLLNRFNEKGRIKYSYPQNLQDKKQFATTMILSKYNVDFGNLSFDIEDPKKQVKNLLFSHQSFCVFKIKTQKQTLTACIFNCHLQSNAGSRSEFARALRQQQIEAIQHFKDKGKFDLFFCIGDTNIGESLEFDLENLFVSSKFIDANVYGHSQNRGSYLLMDINNEITEERLDRLWISKQTASKVQIKVSYADLVLSSYKNLIINRDELIIRLQNGCYQLLTATDHAQMHAQIIIPK